MFGSVNPPNVTTTLEAILDDARDDIANRFSLYRVAADAARDAGDERLAFGLSRLAELKRKPARFSDGATWGWFRTNQRSWEQPPYYLHSDVGKELTGTPDPAFTGWVDYHSFASAILDAARAVAADRFWEAKR